MTMKNSTAARLRRRVRLGEIAYWCIAVPAILIYLAVREAASLIRATWPLWVIVFFGGATVLGLAMVVSGATSAEQRLIGAVFIGCGSAALGMLSLALGD